MYWHEKAAGEFEKSKWSVKPLTSMAHGHWGTKAELPGKFAVSFSTEENGDHVATVMPKVGKTFKITNTIYAGPVKREEANTPLIHSLPEETRKELGGIIKHARELLKKHAPAD